MSASQELEKAATIYLFNRTFQQIPGIGPKLKERIEKKVFNGTLNSLNNAWKVNGIGEEKTNNIRNWVREKKVELPRILNGDFPNKINILEK